MATSERTKRIIWHSFYAVSSALLFVGGFLAWAANEDLNCLVSQPIEKISSLEGILEIPRHSGRSTPIAIRDRSGFEYECYIGDCGYKGVHEDLGKHAKAWLFSGKIVQIEVDGITKLSMQQRVSRLKEARSRSLYMAALGAFLGMAGLFIQHRSAMQHNMRDDGSTELNR